MPGGLSRMTELWKLTFLASGTEGCVGPRVVLDVWVVLGFTFRLDSDQNRSNSFKGVYRQNSGILPPSSLFIKLQLLFKQ